MNNWKINRPDIDTVRKISLKCGISSLTAATLAAKGFSSPEEIAESINVDGLADPFNIKDMREAVDTINRAIDMNERICVYGDYDCDGIMSTVILYTYLTESGADVVYYIPERSEGYGLNNNAVDRIHEKGADLIITVDNGISAISEADYIYSLGMKLVVTDHHQQGEELPRAEAVVDPHRHDCPSEFKHMCGAGIALKLVAALNDGDYTSALEQFGDLAAIATIADIVSLTGENRFLAAYGLKLINNTDRTALIALKEVSGLTGKNIDSRSVGFGLAPRINASGRFGSPKTAVKLFLCDDYDNALSIAQELNRLNDSRKEAEKKIVAQIYEMIDENPALIRERVIFICGKDWHHGVIGIVASKIMERFGKPCFIASESNGEVRGSARSFGNFSVFDSLTYVSTTLEKFGGHLAAGGFTIKNGMTDDFRRLLNEYAFTKHNIMPVYEITADVPVSPNELNVDNIRGVNILEPFGTGNEKPLFYIENALVVNVVPLSGGLYARIKIKFGNVFAEAVSFRIPYNRITVQSGDYCDIIAELGTNEYRERISAGINITDIRPHGFPQNKYFAGLNTFEAFTRNENIPANYYPAMLPTRDQIAGIYKHLVGDGVDSDILYMIVNREENSKKINYCQFCVAVEAMKQLGLVTVSYQNSTISRIKNAPRVDINSAPILKTLINKISGR